MNKDKAIEMAMESAKEILEKSNKLYASLAELGDNYFAALIQANEINLSAERIIFLLKEKKQG